MAEDEGWLIVHVDSDVTIESLTSESYELVRNLPAGRHAWIVRARAGRHAWQSLSPGREAGDSAPIRLPDMRRRLRSQADMDRAAWEAQFKFEVQPGVVNYVGELQLRKQLAGQWRVRIRHLNHAAAGIRALQSRYGDLLDTHQIVYSGPGEDGFLDYYTRERDRVAGTRSREARQ